MRAQKGGRTHTTWKLLNSQQRVVTKAIALRVVFLQQSVLVTAFGFHRFFIEAWTILDNWTLGLAVFSVANLVSLFTGCVVWRRQKQLRFWRL